jgi:hypothetical protein
MTTLAWLMICYLCFSAGVLIGAIRMNQMHEDTSDNSTEHSEGETE